MATQKFSFADVQSSKDLLVIDGTTVYNVSDFASKHPGGKKILLNATGSDATAKFDQFHSRSVLARFDDLIVGTIMVENEAVEESNEDTEYFGDLIPFGDPLHYQGFASPYYNESHHKVRAAMRKFTDKEITPFAHEWDLAREIPLATFKKAADNGILAGILTPIGGFQDGSADGITLPGGVDPAIWDGFHKFIVIDELSRCGSGGVLYGICGGFGIGLPPIIHAGSAELQARVVAPCLRGTKRICLAITEPQGGSDVANLTTTAEKSGEFYKVNGVKKWITGGVYSDYFVVACRTGGPGMGGISLLVVEKGPGVSATKMDCSGVLSSGTSSVVFNDAMVPVANLLGRENKGFALIMHNFNPERLGICMQANRFARVCLEESIKYASQRKTFGVLLRDHGVIRAKIANMATQVESTHAWIESIIYQQSKFGEEELTLRLGGAIALLKAQSTNTFEFCAREAAQIFGGLAYTKGGVGEKVERLNREVRAYSVPGGSSEIMLDLGVRQSIKVAAIMGAKL